MKKTLPILLTIILFLNLSISFAQKLDETYFPQIKGLINPWEMVQQADGKILVLGLNFRYVDSLQVNQLIRLNSDGSLDTSFNPPDFEHELYDVVVAKSGKIIVFYNYRNDFYALNSDGSLDKDFEFEHSSGFTYLKKLFVVGSNFYVQSGKNDLHVTVLEKYYENGKRDESFSPIELEYSYGGSIFHLEKLENGQLVISGKFSKVNGIKKNNLVLINSDGTIDHSFDTGSGFGEDADGVKIKTHKGKILAYGNISTYNGENFPKGIIRLNLDGTIDDSFVSGIISSSFTSRPSKVFVDKNDDLFILGLESKRYYSNFNLLKFTSDGLIDYSFNKISLKLYNGNLHAYILQNDDDDLFVYGGFRTFGKNPIYNFVKVNTAESKLYDYDLKMRGTSWVKKAIKLKNGNTAIIGNFTDVGNTSQPKFAILNKQGFVDKNFNFNYKIGPDDQVNCLSELNDGNILIGGNFKSDDSYKEITVQEKLLLKIDSSGTVDSTFDVYSNFRFASINELKVLNNSQILIVGEFSKINESEFTSMAKIYDSGIIDSTYNPNIRFNWDWKPEIIESLSKDKILLGWIKRVSNSHSYSKIVLLDSTGVLDPSFKELTNYNIELRSITKLTDDKIIYGGVPYQPILSKTKNPLFQYNFNNGFNDSLSIRSFYNDPNFYPVFSDIMALDSNNILIGGQFEEINGFDNQGLAKIQPNGKIDRHFNFNVDGGIFSMVRDDDDHILVFGRFNKIQGKEAFSGARIKISNFVPKQENELKLKIAEDSIMSFTAASLGIIDEDDPLEKIAVTFLPGENYTVEDNQVIPDRDFSGEIKVSVKVSDEKDTIDLIIPIEILAQNDPPAIQKLVSDLSIFETTSIAITKEDFIFSDPDNTLDEIELILIEGENYQVIGDSIVVEKGFNGEISIRAQATDGESLGEVFEFTIDVQTVIIQNEPPAIQELVSDLSIFETTSIAITKEDFTFSDPDNTIEEIDLILLDGENYEVVGDSIVVEEGFNGEITVRVQATDGESLGEVFEFTIEVQTITGLEYEILGKIIIYPNPAKSFVRISNQNNIPILGISMVDLSGKAFQIPIKKNADNWRLNVTDLNSGLYLVNIILQNGSVSKKIQIQ